MGRVAQFHIAKEFDSVQISNDYLSELEAS